MGSHVKFVIAVVAIAVSARAAAPVLGQSLADVARKEEGRRKAIKQPAKVYTNKDLSGVPPPSVPPPASQPAAAPGEPPPGAKAPGADAKGAEKADDAPKDQAYWSARMKGLQDQLDRDQILAEAMQTRINALTADFTARDDPAQRDIISRDRQKALTELDRLKQAIANDKQAIADLAEEARRGGVPPGWLRP